MQACRWSFAFSRVNIILLGLYVLGFRALLIKLKHDLNWAKLRFSATSIATWGCFNFFKLQCCSLYCLRCKILNTHIFGFYIFQSTPSQFFLLFSCCVFVFCIYIYICQLDNICIRSRAGCTNTYEDIHMGCVHVEDVAKAHICCMRTNQRLVDTCVLRLYLIMVTWQQKFQNFTLNMGFPGMFANLKPYGVPFFCTSR